MVAEMKPTKRGETALYWFYAFLMIGGVAGAFVLEAWLFGGAL